MARSYRMTEHGIFLVNKPEGMSSAGLVSRIKRMAGAKKVGHAGTLDPFADGLMICGVNHATRLSRFFLHGHKAYIATVTYGRETDTLDGTGETVAQCDPDFFSRHPDFFSDSYQNDLLQGFLGPQMQLPPVYSALKHHGVPLYKLARKGTPVQKEARSITLERLDLLEVNAPSIRFAVTCSGGTYIRSLAADLGKKAGCGAHLSALTRTECLGFQLEQAVDLDTLSQSSDMKDYLMPMNQALPHMPAAHVNEVLVKKIKHGMPLFGSDLSHREGFVKVLADDEVVIAIVEWDNQAQRYNYCCVFPD